MTPTTTAARAMGTATSRAAIALAGCLAVTAAGCGGSGKSGRVVTGPAHAAASGGVQRAAGLPSIHPAAAPPVWGKAKITTGAVLFYPPGWRLTRTDKGTATVIAVDAQQRIAGYLNLTPRQGGETLADWTSFRVRHNAQEGDREVIPEGARQDLRFRTGRGTCVRDSYTTVSRARYIELACLVRGPSATSVIVGAAPPQQWSTMSPLLARAIGALIT
jgi:hypothetical protein